MPGFYPDLAPRIDSTASVQPRRGVDLPAVLAAEFGADPVQIVILEGADAPPQEQRQERSHDQGGHRHEAEDQMPAQGGAAGEYRSLERPDQHLGAALVVVEFALDRRQRVYASF